MKKTSIANTILWIARIWAAISLIFVLFMIGAHVFGEQESLERALRIDEILKVIFGIGILVGLAMSYKWEGIGGMTTLLCLNAMHVVGKDLSVSMIDLLATPALLFIAYWYLNRKSKKPVVEEGKWKF